MRKALISSINVENLRKEFNQFLVDNNTSITRYCKENDVNPSVIYNFLNSEKWNPKLSSVEVIMGILGYQLVILKHIEPRNEDNRAN